MKTGMKITNGLTAALVAMGIAAATATSVQAQANIITPTIYTGLTTVTALAGYEIVKTVNSSGLTDPNNTPSNVLDDVNSNGTTQWLNGGANIGNEVVTFFLGGTYDVDSIHLWNWVYGNGTETKWGVKNVGISFSTDGTTFGSTETVSFVANPSLTASTAQTKTFSTKSGVTHIQLRNFTSLESGNRVGFGEIRFGSVEAKPHGTILTIR
jgi:hypothetical protein